MNNLATSLPLAGDKLSILPFILIAAAIVIIVLVLIVSKNKKGED